MDKYYCRPIKLYVCFQTVKRDDCFVVYMFGYNKGVLVGQITIDEPTYRPRCAYIDNKTYTWLGDFLKDKKIAEPTYRVFVKDNFPYEEFKFRKDI